jgi:hypothetical protein
MSNMTVRSDSCISKQHTSAAAAVKLETFYGHILLDVLLEIDGSLVRVTFIWNGFQISSDAVTYVALQEICSVPKEAQMLSNDLLLQNI